MEVIKLVSKRRCQKCRLLLHPSLFTRVSRDPLVFSPWCRICKLRYNRSRREKDNKTAREAYHSKKRKTEIKIEKDTELEALKKLYEELKEKIIMKGEVE